MFDERMAESYFHLVAVSAVGFVGKVDKIPGKHRHFMVTALNTCLMLAKAQQNGSVGKWMIGFKLAVAAAATQEIRQTAAAMVAGSNGGRTLDDAHIAYMKKSNRMFARYEGKLRTLSRKHKADFRRKLRKLLSE
jgi:hypothetical protein